MSKALGLSTSAAKTRGKRSGENFLKSSLFVVPVRSDKGNTTGPGYKGILVIVKYLQLFQ